jgi:large subunit ribosomal protein L4
MASLPIYDRSGKQVGSYEIDPSEIAPKISKQLLHDVVVMYQANKRQGTVRTKTRSEVAGTTKKMYRQKGTGNARAGSKRTGIRVGGGHIHALLPRDYSYRLPKKAIQVATRMAIASRLQGNEVVIIDKLDFKAPKTKEMAGILKSLGLGNGSLLITTEERDMNVYKSGRNIDKVTVSPVAELNALTVLMPKKLLVTKAALDAMKARATAKAKAS